MIPLGLNQYLVGGLGLLALGLGVWGYTEDANGDRLETWQDNIVSVTSTAAGVTDKDGKPALLKPKDVAAQIAAMGASVTSLRAGVAQCRTDAATRQREYEASVQRSAARQAQLERQFATARGSIARLEDIARRAQAASTGQCVASAELMRELEDLR
jgi:TolA-binding protein